MNNKILIPLQCLISYFLKPPATGKQQWVHLRDSGRGYSPVCPKDSITCCAFVAAAQAGGGSSVLNFLVPRSTPMETVGKGQALSSFASKL